jgi:hypothetical protein
MMKGRSFVRILIGLLAVSTVSAATWIISLPDKAECRATGRIVDPTKRHCTSATGYQQLEEHATFHAVQIALAGLVVLAAAYIIYRIIRHRSRQVASTG